METRRPASAFAFNHLLTQQAAYNALLGSNRRALHSAAADALAATLVPGALDELPLLARLAVHLESAQRWAEAHRRACELLARRAQLGQVQGWEAAAEHAAQLWALAGAVQPQLPAQSAILANCWASFLARTGRMAESQSYATQALELARAQGDRLQVASALNNRGVAAHYAGFHAEAIDCYRQSREAYLLAGDERGTIQLYNNVGLVLLEVDDVPAALAELQAGLARAEAAANLQLIANLALNTGLAQAELGDTAGGVKLLQHGLATARRIGFLGDEGLCLGYLGEQSERMGKLSTARDYYSSALHLARTIASARFEGWWLMHLGVMDLRAGQLAAARAQLTTALELARRSGSLTMEAYFNCVLAEIELAEDNLPAAQAALAQAEQIDARIGPGRRWRLTDKLAEMRQRVNA